MAVIVGSSTCHLAQSREGVFGSGAAGCYPDATARGSIRSRPARRPPARSSTGIAAISPATSSIEAEKRGVIVFQVLDEQAAAVPPAAEGLVVRDDWQGNRSPYKNPQARGAIAGLVAGPRPRSHLARHLRSDRLRHAPHPRRRLGPRPQSRADLSRRRRGQVAALAADSCRHPQEAHPARTRERGMCARRRRWPPPSPPVSIPTSIRPPARWSRSSRSSSPTRRMRGLRRSLREVRRALPPAQS